MKLADRLKDKTLLKTRCYIDGAWVGDDTSGIKVTDPATDPQGARSG